MDTAPEARVGARVRVREGYRKAQLRGRVGTIKGVYGDPSHAAALEVRFGDGKSELLWSHELEEVEQPRSRRGSWWRFLFGGG
jgi:hypothetical protein